MTVVLPPFCSVEHKRSWLHQIAAQGTEAGTIRSQVSTREEIEVELPELEVDCRTDFEIHSLLV